jgi:hypothetical protein
MWDPATRAILIAFSVVDRGGGESMSGVVTADSASENDVFAPTEV